MKAIIIGDIINSVAIPPAKWIAALEKVLLKYGAQPKVWEIYRGDEFQLMVPIEDVASAVINIKASLKILKLDVRLSIGLGEITYESTKITQSNGSAFVRSGQLFETLKQKKIILAMDSGNAEFDQQMNLFWRFVVSITDGWLPQSAEYVLDRMQNPGSSQEEMGKRLGINQAAVSRRHKRSQIDLLMDFENYYRHQIDKL